MSGAKMHFWAWILAAFKYGANIALYQ